jgi:transposase
MSSHHLETRRSTLFQSSTLFLGMEVHKDSMAGAGVAQEHGAEGPYLGPMGTRQCDIDQLVRTMPSQAQPLVFGYEAGPGGSWLYRELRNTDDDGWGVAPSLIPTKAGARVKTARRDAVQRARLARSGDRPAVDGPTVDDAARRDRTRARAETLSALQDTTCRLNVCWLRHDLRSTGRAHGSPVHRRGLSAVVGPTPAQPIVVQA